MRSLGLTTSVSAKYRRECRHYSWSRVRYKHDLKYVLTVVNVAINCNSKLALPRDCSRLGCTFTKALISELLYQFDDAEVSIISDDDSE